MERIHQLISNHLNIWTTAEAEKKSSRGRSSSNAEKIYGIEKLRQLILDLAIRGKLIPQDPNDEPAKELLKKIKLEQFRFNKMKKQKPIQNINEEQTSIKLPQGWLWVKNSELFQLKKGKIPNNLNENGKGLPYLDIEALDRKVIRRYSEDNTCPISEETDILVVCDGSRSGLILNGRYGIIGSTLSIIYTPFFIQPFIKLIFKQGFKYFNTNMKGAAIPHLDIKKLLQNRTALPPLTEQLRIISKVDELMALCDLLEQKNINSEVVHVKLVKVLLDTLTQSKDASGFKDNWQKIYNHFNTLFRTEDSVDEFKKTLLQLAIMGKVAPQDPNDEPISELFRKVKIDKKKKNLLLITENEKLIKLPKGWEWLRLGLVGEWGSGSTPLRSNSNYYKGDIPWFKSGELSKDLIDKSEETITELAIKKCSLRMNNPGDILLAMYGANIGKTSILGVKGTTNQAVCACTPNEIIFNKYLLLTLKAMRANFINQGAGGAQPNISKEKIIKTIVAVPPINEQKRIVSKVDELMALCDDLKSRIQQANLKQKQVADVLISQALN
jgi:type I restriction enzyme S subunit